MCATHTHGLVDSDRAQELRLTIQTANGRLIHAVIHTDDGIVIALIALAALAVAALGLWSVLALVKKLRKD